MKVDFQFFNFLRNWFSLYSLPTDPEKSLEPHIAKLGLRYRAQHPVRNVGAILDFALLDEKIAIEVDGPNHNQAAVRAKDELRTARLEKLGWVVVRMTNREALNDPESALVRCLNQAKEKLHARSSTDLGDRGSDRGHCATECDCPANEKRVG